MHRGTQSTVGRNADGQRVVRGRCRSVGAGRWAVRIGPAALPYHTVEYRTVEHIVGPTMKPSAAAGGPWNSGGTTRRAVPALGLKPTSPTGARCRRPRFRRTAQLMLRAMKAPGIRALQAADDVGMAPGSPLPRPAEGEGVCGPEGRLGRPRAGAMEEGRPRGRLAPAPGCGSPLLRVVRSLFPLHLHPPRLLASLPLCA